MQIKNKTGLSELQMDCHSFQMCALLFALTVEEQIYNSYIWEERETEKIERG